MRTATGGIRTVFRLRLPLLLFLLPFLSLPALADSPPGTTDAEPPDPYVASLLDAAERLQLHRDRYWHVLLHYKRGLFGLRSLVDDPKFFADPKGKHDARAELRATIRALFTPALPDTSTEKHPVCRFVARYEWLKEKLEIDEARLPVPRCQKLDDLIDQIQPESATLIFPTSHMNSPASMYGHTLLTIETASKSKLLAYAVNYSALTAGSTFAPVYMAKGLLGGYPGYFSILPYYAKLQEYSDVNDRDIWEYPLDLDPDEVRRLVMHVYEMEGIYADYYFFSENCSYGLLFPLEAARPSLRLTDEFGWWVIPLDTIRVVKESGLIHEAIYRPSKSTKVEYLSALLSPDDREQAWEVATGKRDPAQVLERDISTEEKIRICDLASEYLQYIYTKGDLEKDAYQPRFLSTLKARSTLGAAGEWRYSIPPPGRPDEGHRSRRLAVGAGAVEEEPFQEIRLRPAYHELLDNESGYKRGSQIVFCDTAIRYYSRQEKLEMEEIDLIDIVSIAPRTRFFKHVSWKVKTGFFRRTLENRQDYLVYGLNPAFGAAFDNRFLGLSHLLLETDLHVGGALDGDYSLGAGASAGVLRDLTDWWKFQLLGRYLEYPLGDDLSYFQASLGQSVKISTNLSLSLGVERTTEHDDSTIETKLSGNVFF